MFKPFIGAACGLSEDAPESTRMSINLFQDAIHGQPLERRVDAAIQTRRSRSPWSETRSILESIVGVDFNKFMHPKQRFWKAEQAL